MTPTTPRPLLRMTNQFPFDGIPVHVIQFLPQLLFAPHIEIVETPLPEVSFVSWSFRERQRQLVGAGLLSPLAQSRDRKSTRLNSSHPSISYAVFCLKKKKKKI